MHYVLELLKFKHYKHVTLICIEHAGEKDRICQESIRVWWPFPAQAGSPGPLCLHQDTDRPCRGGFESSIFYLWAQRGLFLYANKISTCSPLSPHLQRLSLGCEVSSFERSIVCDCLIVSTGSKSASCFLPPLLMLTVWAPDQGHCLWFWGYVDQSHCVGACGCA